MRDRIESGQAQENYRLIAWAISAVDLVLLILLTILYILVRGNVVWLLDTIAFGLFVFIGAVIITRQPHNLVAWIGITVGFTFVINDLMGQYSIYSLTIHPIGLPFGDIASWVSAWLWVLTIFLAVPFILLIPNGHLPSPRWRWVILVTAILAVITIFGIMVASWPARGKQLLEAQNSNAVLAPLGETFSRLIYLIPSLMNLLIIAAAIAMLRRFIYSQGVERLQLKWIMLACLTIPITIGVSSFTGSISDPLLSFLNQIVSTISAFAMPIAFGIAMTRYRLYEIDVIIRRTLVYTILSLVLALVYFGSVLILQEGFTLVTGQQSPVSIVVSTLLIAALFTPLRVGIQQVIDRRFYRRKYQADKMLAQFAATQRETVEMEQINQRLLQIVEEALQPEFVSLAFVKKPAPENLGGKRG